MSSESSQFDLETVPDEKPRTRREVKYLQKKVLQGVAQSSGAQKEKAR